MADQAALKPARTLRNRAITQREWRGHHPTSGAEWAVLNGDVCEVLRQLPADHFSTVVTSPPYFWQRDYGVKGQIGKEPTVKDYVNSISNSMDEVRRVLAPTGVLFLNLGDTYYSGKGQPHGTDRKHSGRRFNEIRAVDASGLGMPQKSMLGMPWRVALEMIDRGWILRSSIIWHRTKAIPEPSAVDRPWQSYEFIFLFAKSRHYDFDRSPLKECKCEDVWTIEAKSSPRSGHPAVFPRELVERCLTLGNPNASPVLDPFAGSGTVLDVATSLSMPATGVELSPEYCKAIVRRLKKSA